MSESANIDVNNLTKEQLWKLRQEIVLGSLYTHDYDNSFGIDPSAVCNFFDSFIEDAQVDDYGRPNNREIKEYDNAEDLYNYYRSCENPFGEIDNINESTELDINDIEIGDSNNMETIRKYVSAQEQHKGTSIRFDTFKAGPYEYDLRIYVGGLTTKDEVRAALIPYKLDKEGRVIRVNKDTIKLDDFRLDMTDEEVRSLVNNKLGLKEKPINEDATVDKESKSFFGHTIEDDLEEYGGPVGFDRFYQRAIDFGVEDEAFETYGNRSQSSVEKVVKKYYKEYKEAFKNNLKESKPLLDNDPDLDADQVQADVDYWTDVDEANTEDVTGMEPVGVYSVSNSMTIYVYQIEYDIEDRVLVGDSSDETKAKWRDIIYGDGEAYFWYGDIKVPFNELMRTDI